MAPKTMYGLCPNCHVDAEKHVTRYGGVWAQCNSCLAVFGLAVSIETSKFNSETGEFVKTSSKVNYVKRKPQALRDKMKRDEMRK